MRERAYLLLTATVVAVALVIALPEVAQAQSYGLGYVVLAAGLIGVVGGSVSTGVMIRDLAQGRLTHPTTRGIGFFAAAIDVTAGAVALCLTPYVFEDHGSRVAGFVTGGVLLSLGITAGLLAFMVRLRPPAQRYSFLVGPTGASATVRF